MEAKPTTPPQDVGVRGAYECILDHNHKPFSIIWWGSPEYPDLATFPALENVEIPPVHQTPSMAVIWGCSTLLDYDSHASIRTTEHSRFPILKLAHSDTESIRLVQREFSMLVYLATLDLPAVEVDRTPIVDNGKICGYRMKELFKVEPSELESRRHEVKYALSRLHSAGVCHGDITPSNIMKDHRGRITLIDFGSTGKIGSKVPWFIPSWVYSGDAFSIDVDWKAFDRYMTIDNLYSHDVVRTSLRRMVTPCHWMDSTAMFLVARLCRFYGSSHPSSISRPNLIYSCYHLAAIVLITTNPIGCVLVSIIS